MTIFVISPTKRLLDLPNLPGNIILYMRRLAQLQHPTQQTGGSMTTADWVHLITISGSINAEILKGLFEAQDIDVQLYQEAVGKSVYPVNFGMLGEVEIYVKASDLETARQLLSEIENELQSEDDEEESPEESSGNPE